MNFLRTFLPSALLLLSVAWLRGGPIHEVLYQWVRGPEQIAHTEFTETPDGFFIGAGGGGAHGFGCVFRVAPTGGILPLAHFTGNGATNKGANPQGRLVRGNDGAYYGTTVLGGASDVGTIYKVTLAGEITTLVEFTGNAGSAKGSRPQTGLILGSDGAFYGTTNAGGAGGAGTVFRLTAEGVFTTLAEFTYAGGGFPGGRPVEGSDGNFYGTTRIGGANEQGTIFKLTPSGTLTTLVNFTGDGAGNRGSYPESSLTESGGNFYGTTSLGGAGNFGTVFKVTPEGVLTTLVEFTKDGAANRGALPLGGLSAGADGALYGTTRAGGASDLGTIFKVTTDGVLTTLVEFTGNGTQNRGSLPHVGLTLGSNGSFYGTTNAGGGPDQGTIFKMTAEGTLTTLNALSIRGALNSGGSPEAGLIADSNGELYGTTRFGGAHGFGTVFKFMPGGPLTKLVDFTGVDGSKKGAYPAGRLARGRNGGFYGTTTLGGAGNFGTIFDVSNTGFLRTLVQFTGISGDTLGASPQAGLVPDNQGNFYGTTQFGGGSDPGGVLGRGTVFKLTPNEKLTTLVQFTGNGASNRGQFPTGELVASFGSSFRGTTTSGGASNQGTVFEIFDGRLTTLLDFDAFGGLTGPGHPAAGLCLGNDGSFYGSTTTGGLSSGGGDPGPGTIFKVRGINRASTVVELTGRLLPSKGREIRSALVLGPDGDFYGTSSRGGALDAGTVFKVTPAGVLTTLIEFGADPTLSKGAEPIGSLVLGPDGSFYGTTSSGGRGGGGTIFRLSEVTSVQRKMLAVGGGAVAGEPSGTRFLTFGRPALDSLGGAAFTATLQTAAGVVKAVLVGDPAQVVARTGDVAPDTGGAIFESFDPPLISEAGIAFSAKLRHGAGVDATNDTGVWTTARSSRLEMVARQGSAVPDVAGGTVQRIRTFSLRGADLALWLRLTAGPNDDVLVNLNTSGWSRLLGEGDVVAGASPVKTFSVFTPAMDAPGQDRWHAPGALAVVATFQNGKKAVLELRPGQPARVLANYFSPAPAGLGQGRWIDFGLPAVGAAGITVLRGQQRAGLGAVSEADDHAIIASEGDATQVRVIRENDSAPGLAGVRFGRPADPVVNDQGHIAFLAALRGAGVTPLNHTSLWTGAHGSLRMVARTGDLARDAAGAPQPGVRYASFRSFGLPDGVRVGPLFIASLTGSGVTAENQTALFATDSAGLVRMLLRTGDRVGKTVAAFSALDGGGLPVGTRRAFSKAGSVAALVQFTDRTAASVRIDYP